MTILPKLQELTNVRIPNATLDALFRRSDKPYYVEVDQEADRLSDLYQHRDYFEVYRKSTIGKLGEIFIRETYPELFFPVTTDTLEAHAQAEWIDETADVMTLDQAINFHDIISKPTGEIIEVKRWLPKSKALLLPKFIESVKRKTNASHILVLFGYDEKETWVDEIIKLK